MPSEASDMVPIEVVRTDAFETAPNDRVTEVADGLLDGVDAIVMIAQFRRIALAVLETVGPRLRATDALATKEQ